MHVAELLRHKGDRVITAQPHEAVWSVLRRYQTHHVGALVVVDEHNRLIGMLTERDLLSGLVANGKRMLDLPVREVMATGPPVCSPGDAVGHVMTTMTERRTRHLPVVEDDLVVGVVSLGDVVKAALDDAEAEVKVLRDLANVRR